MTPAGPVHEACVIGAGITGINALVVAASYLGTGDTLSLVDARPLPGGMWVDTYDYVRLHQPHGIFTAGDIPWTLGAAPAHLATKAEVLTHLTHCVDVAKQQVRVEEHYGWEYVSHLELPDLVEVTIRSTAPGSGQVKVIRARRLIKAFGHRLPPAQPLALSSTQVRSVTPEMLGSDQPAAADPVWVVGAGKTATDTVQLLLRRHPDRTVNLVAGPGVFFARRDTFFPVGVRRWWSGTPINTMVRQAANRFDGTNETDVRDWFRTTYGISPLTAATDYFNGYLSERECAVIRAGLGSVEHEYLADVTDSAEGPELVFRSGRTRPVAVGSWIVNCTGSLLRGSHPYEPFLSPGGRVVSLQMRSSTTGVFSAFAGYYLPHLLFLGALRDAGLYALDVEELHHKAKAVAIYASMSLTIHNLAVIAGIVPMRVLLGCGLDFDRWYPVPRRMLGAVRFKRAARNEMRHHRIALDTLGRRFDLVCGPLPSAAGLPSH